MDASRTEYVVEARRCQPEDMDRLVRSLADKSVFILQRKSEILERHCADLGRSPAEIERSVAVDRGPADLAADLVAAGATLFTIGVNGPDYDLGLASEWIAWRNAQ